MSRKLTMGQVAVAIFVATAPHGHQGDGGNGYQGGEPWQRNGKRKGVKAR